MRWQAFGVTTAPGVTFANSFMMREELDHFRRVIVAYDHEVKDDPKVIRTKIRCLNW